MEDTRSTPASISTPVLTPTQILSRQGSDIKMAVDVFDIDEDKVVSIEEFNENEKNKSLYRKLGLPIIKQEIKKEPDTSQEMEKDLGEISPGPSSPCLNPTTPPYSNTTTEISTFQSEKRARTKQTHRKLGINKIKPLEEKVETEPSLPKKPSGPRIKLVKKKTAITTEITAPVKKILNQRRTQCLKKTTLKKIETLSTFQQELNNFACIAERHLENEDKKEMYASKKRILSTLGSVINTSSLLRFCLDVANTKLQESGNKVIHVNDYEAEWSKGYEEAINDQQNLKKFLLLQNIK